MVSRQLYGERRARFAPRVPGRPAHATVLEERAIPPSHMPLCGVSWPRREPDSQTVVLRVCDASSGSVTPSASWPIATLMSAYRAVAKALHRAPP